MSRLKTEFFNFMPFHWTYEDEKDGDIKQNVIRTYGWNEKNESVYCFITDFDIPIWFELPDDKEWTESLIQRVLLQLKNVHCKEGNKPTTIKHVYKEKLYYANIEKTKEGYKNKKYSFIEVSFRNLEAISFFVASLKRKPLYVPGVGEVILKAHTAEGSITPVLKLLAIANLPSSSWIKCKGICIPEEDKTSTKMHEYRVSYKDMVKLPDEECMKMPIVYPTIMSFDNEAYSSVSGSMPNANNPKDKVFMIGFTILTQKVKTKNIKSICYLLQILMMLKV